MARRKAATRKKKNSRASAPAWLWLLVGLVIGLGAAAAFHAWQEGREAPSQQAGTAPAATAGQAAPPTPPAPQKPVPQTEAREDTGPRFDFYTLLPQIEVEIPREKLEEALRLLPKTDKDGIYILQAGSFRDYGDADELKARLALLGIEADIQTVVIKNGSSWHRVRIGPFKGLDAVKPVRRKLKRNHIDFVVLKIGTED